MKQPWNFASVVEGTLNDENGGALFDLLSSPNALHYELDPVLVSKIIISLSPKFPTHRFVHARLVDLLQNHPTLASDLISTFPSVYYPDEEEDFAKCILDNIDNFYRYSVLVNAVIADHERNLMKCQIQQLCAFSSFGNKPAQTAICECIFNPFLYDLTFSMRELAVKLAEVVFTCNGIRCVAEFSASNIGLEYFLAFLKHLPMSTSKASLIHQLLLLKGMTSHEDLNRCAIFMKNIGQDDPLRLEFLLTILCIDQDKSTKDKILKKNKFLYAYSQSSDKIIR